MSLNTKAVCYVVFVLVWVAFYFVKITTLTFNEQLPAANSTAFAPPTPAASQAIDAQQRRQEMKVTIVMPTYRRIEAILENPTISNLAGMDMVDKLLLLWNDVGSVVPQQVHDHLVNISVDGKVVIIHPTSNSLNNRLIPWPEIGTECVFTVDDDFSVDADAFKVGFEWWKLNQFRLVGFYPRHFTRKKSTRGFKYEYVVVKSPGETYSALLSGGGLFLHRQYLQRYTNAVQSKHREMVDAVMNCEDILLQFVVPASQHPPLLVGSHPTGLGNNSWRFTRLFYDMKTGLSSKGGHYKRRERCIEEFASDFGWPFVPSTHYQYTLPSILEPVV